MKSRVSPKCPVTDCKALNLLLVPDMTGPYHGFKYARVTQVPENARIIPGYA